MGLFFLLKGDIMFRKIFNTQRTQCSIDCFESLIHTLSSMNEQKLVNVEQVLELVFDGDKAEVMVSIKDSSTVVPLTKDESLDDRVDKAKAQLKTDELEKRIEEFKKGRR
ncbi:hypothetical protein GPU55_08920 [Streptococcus thermophilus]|nr:hypothetical protein [Streptococcus thermophilus]